MENEELLIVIKDMFESTVGEIKREFTNQISDYKNHVGVLFEKLDGDIRLLAEGHAILSDRFDKMEIRQDRLEAKIDSMQIQLNVLDKKVDNLDKRLTNVEIKVDSIDKRLTNVESKVEGLCSDMSVVKNYVIGVDAKLNEHEIILKRVK